MDALDKLAEVTTDDDDFTADEKEIKDMQAKPRMVPMRQHLPVRNRASSECPPRAAARPSDSGTRGS